MTTLHVLSTTLQVSDVHFQLLMPMAPHAKFCLMNYAELDQCFLKLLHKISITNYWDWLAM